MKTVKEISEVTGVSIRTLHYYDKIGLLVPAAKTDAGYRLYSDADMERLEQILYFREFDIPLKEIKSIMNQSDFDRNQILTMQREMLVAKKERLERLIANIDHSLNGDHKKDFSVFNKTELEEMFRIMVERMPENMKALTIKDFGGVSKWKDHYIKTLSSPKMQEQYAEIIELYGGKENYIAYMKESVPQNEIDDFKLWEDRLISEIVKLWGDKKISEAKKAVIEYGIGCRKFYKIKDEKKMMLSMAKSLRNNVLCKNIDEPELFMVH